jgi:ABC-type phosphate transport system substrate-binding protein
MNPKFNRVNPLNIGTVLALALFLLAPLAHADSLAIVVAKSVPVDNLSSDELAKILKCDETDGPGGTKFVLYSREKNTAERAAILKLVYHMSEAEYNRFFMQAVFAGKITAAPRIITSAAAMKSVAASHPGAIAYVLASQLDDSVKALKIDGLAPTDPAYPLKVD